MWVADMDFQTAPAIIDALRERVNHGIFGYARVPDSYYEAIIHWFAEHHGFQIQKEWILYTTGVVPAISAILRALTHAGDRVLVQTPVYNCFFSSIRNLDCQLSENRLLNKQGRYEIDFEDLERKTADPNCKVLLLCNPHNPVGRVWTKEELTRVGEICLKNHVIVVSDEIHCDLVLDPSKRHIPFASINDDFLQNSITCISPSKSFNLAGLQVANIVVYDSDLRGRIDKAINIHEICDINPFGIEALIAAYTHSADWLSDLQHYLLGNYEYLKSFIEKQLGFLQVSPLEATYLAWVDGSRTGYTSAELTRMLGSQGVKVNPGTLYGEAGEGFIRINFASPRSILQQALLRMQSVLCGNEVIFKNKISNVNLSISID